MAPWEDAKIDKAHTLPTRDSHSPMALIWPSPKLLQHTYRPFGGIFHSGGKITALEVWKGHSKWIFECMLLAFTHANLVDRSRRSLTEHLICQGEYFIFKYLVRLELGGGKRVKKKQPFRGMEIPEGGSNRGAAGELSALGVIRDESKASWWLKADASKVLLKPCQICQYAVTFGLAIVECIALAPLIRAGRDLTVFCSGGLRESS